MASSIKPCAICGEDTSDRPRTRDMRGRFYCQTCYQQAREQKRVDHDRPPPAPAKTAHSPPPRTAVTPRNFAPPDQIALEPIASAPPQRVMLPREQAAACQACGAAMVSDADVCLSCGFDRRTGQHIDVRALRAALPVPPRQRSTWFMAPVYLFLRPSRYYKQFVVDPAPVLTALFAWLYGMASAMDRIDSRVATSQMSGRSSSIPDSWAVHWGMILGIGIVGGLIYAALGGWWYRLRLQWCSVPSPDWAMVRRVYLTSSAVYAIPAVVWRIVQSMMYAKPSEAWNAGFNLFDGLVMLALMWSVWISYVGVRTVFRAAKWRAVLLFLLLPGVMYALALGAVAVAALLIASAPPNVRRPATHLAPRFIMQYPSNWHIDRQDPSYDPAANFYIDSYQGAAVHVKYFDAEGEAEDHLAWTTTLMQSSMPQLRDGGRPFGEWGQLRGKGRVLQGVVEGDATTIRMFVSEVKQGTFVEITEVIPDADAARLEPGLQLIRSTFRVR